MTAVISDRSTIIRNIERQVCAEHAGSCLLMNDHYEETLVTY